MTAPTEGSRDASAAFDTQAAVTRSMLGWGVLAGPIYLGVGLLLALTRTGFELAEHPLSLLMLGDGGWMQRINLLASGLICGVAAVGFRRAMNRTGSPSRAPYLVLAFAVGLVGSGIFAPDPVDGFPPGAESDVTASGLFHLAFGAFQFVCLAAACFLTARWAARRGDTRWSRFSWASGTLIVVGFVGGAALSTSPIGIVLLWVAVVTSYTWIASTSVYLWNTVPHPDAHRRVTRATRATQR
jgi:Protein of unknown function (DUF998)